MACAMAYAGAHNAQLSLTRRTHRRAEQPGLSAPPSAASTLPGALLRTAGYSAAPCLTLYPPATPRQPSVSASAQSSKDALGEWRDLDSRLDSSSSSSSSNGSNTQPALQTAQRHLNQGPSNGHARSSSNSSGRRSSYSGSGHTEAGRQMMGQIQGCRTWEDLKALFLQSRSDMDTRGLVALVKQVKQVERQKRYTKYEDTEVVEILDQVVQELSTPQRLESLDARGISNLLWGFARLEHHPGLAFMDSLLDRMLPMLMTQDHHRRVDPISLSQTLWALAKLRHTPTQDWFAAYYQAARGSLGQLTPQGLSNMIWAAAALQAPPSQYDANFMHDFLTASLHCLRSHTPQALATTLWALAAFGVHPPATWLSAFWQASAAGAHGRECKAVDLAMLLSSAARLRLRPPGHWVAGMLEAALPEMHSCPPQELVNLLWATVTLGHQPSAEWVDRMLPHAQAKLPRMQSQELSNFVWSLARLDVGDTSDTRLAIAFFRASFPALPYMTPLDCSMTLWGIGRLGWTPPEPWLEAAMEESFKLLPYLKPQEVANVVWAWSQLGTWPSQAWLDRLFLDTLPRLMTFRSAELSAILFALAEGKVKPPKQWMTAYLAATYAHMPSCSSQALANITAALVRLGFNPSPKWIDMLITHVQPRAAATLRALRQRHVQLHGDAGTIARTSQEAHRAEGHSRASSTTHDQQPSDLQSEGQETVFQGWGAGVERGRGRGRTRASKRAVATTASTLTDSESEIDATADAVTALDQQDRPSKAGALQLLLSATALSLTSWRSFDQAVAEQGVDITQQGLSARDIITLGVSLDALHYPLPPDLEQLCEVLRPLPAPGQQQRQVAAPGLQHQGSQQVQQQRQRQQQQQMVAAPAAPQKLHGKSKAATTEEKGLATEEEVTKGRSSSRSKSVVMEQKPHVATEQKQEGSPSPEPSKRPRGRPRKVQQEEQRKEV